MTTQVVIPAFAESIKSVTLSQWLKKPGDAVSRGQSIAMIDSDKASMEIPAPEAGVLSEVLVAEGEEVAVGATIARIDEGGGAVAGPPKEEAKADKGAPKAGPAVRQAADQKGVDLGGVEGSGPRGQILREDLTRATPEAGRADAGKAEAKPEAAKAPEARVEAPRAEAPAASTADRTERVKMTPLRRTIARRLVEAKQTTAMLTTFNEIDMSAAMELRKRYQDAFVAKNGIKLGFMSFFVKATIEALKAFPAVNAEVGADEFIYKRFYNIGVAVSAPKGLVVPIVRDADRLSFAETEKAIAELGVRAKDNKLAPSNFEGGTFTISNGGVFGSLMSTPILNPPQVGILGMHNIVERPVARAGQVVIRPMMYVALSYDHRIIDGREAVGFLVRVKDLVEAPERILLEV
jgi:2-oxoglutarate dehydrogenase E2 component (dihydrolipoamide succinyltransferase)